MGEDPRVAIVEVGADLAKVGGPTFEVLHHPREHLPAFVTAEVEGVSRARTGGFGEDESAVAHRSVAVAGEQEQLRAAPRYVEPVGIRPLGRAPVKGAPRQCGCERHQVSVRGVTGPRAATGSVIIAASPTSTVAIALGASQRRAASKADSTVTFASAAG